MYKDMDFHLLQNLNFLIAQKNQQQMQFKLLQKEQSKK